MSALATLRGPTPGSPGTKTRSIVPIVCNGKLSSHENLHEDSRRSERMCSSPRAKPPAAGGDVVYEIGLKPKKQSITDRLVRNPNDDRLGGGRQVSAPSSEDARHQSRRSVSAGASPYRRKTKSPLKYNHLYGDLRNVIDKNVFLTPEEEQREERERERQQRASRESTPEVSSPLISQRGRRRSKKDTNLRKTIIGSPHLETTKIGGQTYSRNGTSAFLASGRKWDKINEASIGVGHYSPKFGLIEKRVPADDFSKWSGKVDRIRVPESYGAKFEVAAELDKTLSQRVEVAPRTLMRKKEQERNSHMFESNVEQRPMGVRDSPDVFYDVKYELVEARPATTADMDRTTGRKDPKPLYEVVDTFYGDQQIGSSRESKLGKFGTEPRFPPTRAPPTDSLYDVDEAWKKTNPRSNPIGTINFGTVATRDQRMKAMDPPKESPDKMYDVAKASDRLMAKNIASPLMAKQSNRPDTVPAAVDKFYEVEPGFQLLSTTKTSARPIDLKKTARTKDVIPPANDAMFDADCANFRFRRSPSPDFSSVVSRAQRDTVFNPKLAVDKFFDVKLDAVKPRTASSLRFAQQPGRRWMGDAGRGQAPDKDYNVKYTSHVVAPRVKGAVSWARGPSREPPVPRRQSPDKMYNVKHDAVSRREPAFSIGPASRTPQAKEARPKLSKKPSPAKTPSGSPLRPRRLY